MITLATLEQATAQEVFDQVVTHLLTQKKKSISKITNGCVYKSEDGLKYAAGCLMGDDEYDPMMETNTWWNLFSGGFVKTSKHIELINKLQKVHDSAPIRKGYEAPSQGYWRTSLKEVAEEFNLKFNPPQV